MCSLRFYFILFCLLFYLASLAFFLMIKVYIFVQVLNIFLYRESLLATQEYLYVYKFAACWLDSDKPLIDFFPF